MKLIFLLLFCYFNIFTSSVYLNFVVGLNNWVLNFFFCQILYFSSTTLKLSRLILVVFFSMGLFFLKPGFFFLNLEIDLSLITSLWIGTIIIHPLFLYTFLIIFFIYLKYVGVFKYKFITFRELNFLIFLGSIALLLGGVWGLQSFTWGFFWVGDGIEWVLFLSINLLLIYSHSTINTSYFKLYLYYLFLFLLFLLLIRLNFISTRHSFIITTPIVSILNFTYYTVFSIILLTISKKKVRLKFWPIIISFICTGLIMNFSLMIFLYCYITLYCYVFFLSYLVNIFSSYLRIYHLFLAILSVVWSQKKILLVGFFFKNLSKLLSFKINLYTISSGSICWKISTSFIESLEKINFISIDTSGRIYNYLLNKNLYIYILNTYYWFFLLVIVLLYLYIYKRVYTSNK